MDAPSTGTKSEPAEAAQAAAWDRLTEAFLDGYFAKNPATAVALGRHEHDGRLPDWSGEGLARQAAWLHAERDAAERFAAASLDAERRFERDLLLAQIDNELFWLETAEWPWRNPMFYAGPIDPSAYLTRDYAPPPQRLRAFTAYARALPEAARQVRANLRTPMPRTYAELGVLTFSGLADYCEKDVPQIFAAVTDPDLQSALREASAPAVAALRELGGWFKEQAAAGDDEFRLGPELFARMLRDTEGVDVPLADLAAAARRDLERNLEAMADACARLMPGATVAECVARVQAQKPPEGPVAAARRQLAGLHRFVVERELVTIPGREEARVEEAPAYQRWNSAYIDIPGPYERHLPSIYYIAPPDPAWTAEERDAYLPGEADLLFVTAHEVWPGHFLQFLHSNRAPRPLARAFVGYGFAEGWAHYSEEMIWEAGFGDGDPATHIGQLQNALLRNVRFVVAIGLHAGDLTLEQAEAMFREQGFQDPANARQQAARGTFDPAYLNYTLGKLLVRKLRDDWTAPRGGRAAWRAFHDRLLSFGGPPLPLVRAAMLDGASGSLL